MTKQTSKGIQKLKFLNISILFLPVLALLAFGSCQSIPDIINEPSVIVDSVTLKKISFDGVDMIAKVNLKNTNPFTIPFPEIDWTLFVNGKSFLNGLIKNGAKIGANKTISLDIPFTVSYKGLYEFASALLDSDETPYKVNVGATFAIPVLGDKRFSADFSGTIPVLKIPALSFSKIVFKGQSAGKIEFVLTWLIENKNGFSFNLDTFNYDFSVNNASWAKGAAPSKLAIPARKTTEVPVTISINAPAMISEILSFISSPNKVSYRCSGEAGLRPAFAGLNVFTLPFNFSGETNFRN